MAQRQLTATVSVLDAEPVLRYIQRTAELADRAFALSGVECQSELNAALEELAQSVNPVDGPDG